MPQPLPVSASISQYFELGKSRVSSGCVAQLKITCELMAAHSTIPSLSSLTGTGLVLLVLICRDFSPRSSKDHTLGEQGPCTSAALGAPWRACPALPVTLGLNLSVVQLKTLSPALDLLCFSARFFWPPTNSYRSFSKPPQELASQAEVEPTTGDLGEQPGFELPQNRRLGWEIPLFHLFLSQQLVPIAAARGRPQSRLPLSPTLGVPALGWLIAVSTSVCLHFCSQPAQLPTDFVSQAFPFPLRSGFLTTSAEP